MNITEEQSREAFEKWGMNESPHLTDFRRQEQGGKYKSQDTRWAYLSWQAAIRFTQGHLTTPPKITSVVNDQLP